KEIVKSTGRANEITLVTLTGLFPGRYVEDVAFLKERYLQRTSGNDAAQAKFELHTEGDGTAFPDLFLPEAEPRRYLANLLIGRGMNTVELLEDPDTGISSLYLLTKDSRGLDEEPMRLGATFADAWANPNAEAYDALSMTVSQSLASDFLHQSRREE